MKAVHMVVIVAAALLAVAVAWAAWLFWQRPLAVYAWKTRWDLRSSGLHQRLVPSPAGPQCVFSGGSGPPLVLLHGAGDQAGSWSRLAVPLLREHTLIVPDLAGHGRSHPRRGPISVQQVLAGVEAVMAEYASRGPAVVVGNSLGGWMAMLVAHRHPEWVKRVIVVNGGAITGTNEEARILPRTRQEARQAMAQVRDAASPKIPDFVLDDVVREAQRGPLSRLAASAATMGSFTLDGRLGEIGPPVHLVWGESDTLMPLDYARRMLRELPQATLATIPRCGHVPQVECPDKLLAVLLPLVEAP